MAGKSRQAVLIGLVLWVAGAAALVLLGRLPAFPMVAPAATFLLTPPAMYFVTKFHLRGVSAPARIATGLRLAVLVTVVQLPLDALGLLSVRQLGLPELDLSAQQATVLALQAGYFWMLLIPWWASARPSSK